MTIWVLYKRHKSPDEGEQNQGQPRNHSACEENYLYLARRRHLHYLDRVHGQMRYQVASCPLVAAQLLSAHFADLWLP
jgi:hypothetical protein